MDPYRNLLIIGLNEALKRRLVSLDAAPDTRLESDPEHIFLDISGYNSVFIWNDIGYGELRISIWLDYKHELHPQANFSGNSRENFHLTVPLADPRKYKKFVGATVSGWLERKNSKHIQGYGRDKLFDIYTRRGMKEVIEKLKPEAPCGYLPEGKFYL